MDRVAQEREYWDKAAIDPDVDEKYIANISADYCVDALSPIDRVYATSGNGGLAILDLGCGVGRLAIPFAQRHIYVTIVGVDISRQMLNIASMRARAAKVDNFKTKLGDGRIIPLSDGSCMAAYSMLLFQHLPPDAVEGYISEVARVLTPGGLFEFQYVPDAEAGDFSFGHSNAFMEQCLKNAGFKDIKFNNGLILPNWNWVKGVKI